MVDKGPLITKPVNTVENELKNQDDSQQPRPNIKNTYINKINSLIVDKAYEKPKAVKKDEMSHTFQSSGFVKDEQELGGPSNLMRLSKKAYSHDSLRPEEVGETSFQKCAQKS